MVSRVFSSTLLPCWSLTRENVYFKPGPGLTRNTNGTEHKSRKNTKQITEQLPKIHPPSLCLLVKIIMISSVDVDDPSVGFIVVILMIIVFNIS